jgi:hypothetical protein
MWAHVEWVGRVGHPSSYGLLGGARAEASAVRVQSTGERFEDSLASTLDDVRWGLEAEYQTAVLEVLSAQPQGVLVSKAAQGALGSSQYVFTQLARFLCAVLETGVPVEDSDVWRLRDEIWESPEPQ